MCGRYYYDEKAIKETLALIPKQSSLVIDKKTMYPGDFIPIMSMEKGMLSFQKMKWGYTLKGQTIINARSETLLEKKMFSSDAKQRRCLIPCSGFYEWDEQHHPFTFENNNEKVILMAGVYSINHEVVIITTSANDTISPIHHRMPLIIEEEDIYRWLEDDQYLPSLLQNTNNHIKIKTGTMQERLFD